MTTTLWGVGYNFLVTGKSLETKPWWVSLVLVLCLLPCFFFQPRPRSWKQFIDHHFSSSDFYVSIMNPFYFSSVGSQFMHFLLLRTHITQFFTHLLSVSTVSPPWIPKLGFDILSNVPVAHISSIVILITTLIACLLVQLLPYNVNAMKAKIISISFTVASTVNPWIVSGSFYLVHLSKDCERHSAVCQVYLAELVKLADVSFLVPSLYHEQFIRSTHFCFSDTSHTSQEHY